MYHRNTDFIAVNEGSIQNTRIQASFKVLQSGPEGWGLVLVSMVFGAWLRQVLLEAGVAVTLICKITELGGDESAITCTPLCIATTAIFSLLFGAGAVIAISVIILPIFMSLGVPKVLSAVSFMLSIGTGMFLNPVPFGQYTAFFLNGDSRALYPYEQCVKQGGTALAVQLVSIIILVLFCMGRKLVHSWATRRPIRRKLNFAPTSSLLTPFIPVFLLTVLRVPIIMGLLTSGFYVLFIYGKLKSLRAVCRTFNRDFFDGMVDTASLIGLLLVVLMFNKTAESCIPYFNALLGNIIPHSTLPITVTFCVLAPFEVFRSPSILYGCGAATLGILKGVGFEAAFLALLMVTATTVMNVLRCITQLRIVWGVSYAKVSTKEFSKMNVVRGQVTCCIPQVTTFIMFG